MPSSNTRDGMRVSATGFLLQKLRYERGHIMSTRSHRIDEPAPRLQAPPGACDTHIHFYGPPERYPLASTATFTPPPAALEAYRQVQQRPGLQRVVVVQPSAYGFDNRCTLDAARQLGDMARAVVVVDPDIIDEELQRLTNAGVCAGAEQTRPASHLSSSTVQP
jgi:predicted TIM-barrel fold metal-dependent hydrolase